MEGGGSRIVEGFRERGGGWWQEMKEKEAEHTLLWESFYLHTNWGRTSHCSPSPVLLPALGKAAPQGSQADRGSLAPDPAGPSGGDHARALSRKHNFPLNRGEGKGPSL